ncbi:nitric oxide reductase transcriptional regulator NorR [Thalassolituus sp.]|uniref:nitric oxide reductase transcriptional regulator NorR n=1 Tax=Thalassolituus sp. TaxID=2030822 RepID=UPI00351467B0
MPFEQYLSVIEDLSRDMPVEVRYRRLLEAIKQTIPCDAIALLKQSGRGLQPVAFLGLRDEIRGRHFDPAHHPRLDAIVNSDQLVRFPADSPLPDPYDGLVNSDDSTVHVHDCMGVAIQVDGRPWGVITMDALCAGQFDAINANDQAMAISLTQAVITAAERINELRRKVRHGDRATAEMNRDSMASSIVGSSNVMTRLFEDIRAVAPTPLSVLIEGETGVGKELIAQQLHLKSDRFNKPLIRLNCAALPESLAEAELFGHTRGAFTGADRARPGRFELADGGTLFLDEIGELPLALQATLLRVLEVGEVQRVGSDETLKVDVRVLAATNRDLRQEVIAGRFREDLFHRLSVFPLHVPALRERGQDILELAEYFLERLQTRLNIHRLLLTPDARTALRLYRWPGNVRELEHVLSRAALRAQQGQRESDVGLVYIDRAALAIADTAAHTESASTTQPVPPHDEVGSLTELTQAFQRRVIDKQLAQHNGNVAAAARALNVDRSNLLRLIKRLGGQTA